MKDPQHNSLATEADELTLLQSVLQLTQRRVQHYRSVIAQAPIGTVATA